MDPHSTIAFFDELEKIALSMGLVGRVLGKSGTRVAPGLLSTVTGAAKTTAKLAPQARAGTKGLLSRAREASLATKKVNQSARLKAPLRSRIKAVDKNPASFRPTTNPVLEKATIHTPEARNALASRPERWAVSPNIKPLKSGTNIGTANTISSPTGTAGTVAKKIQSAGRGTPYGRKIPITSGTAVRRPISRIAA